MANHSRELLHGTLETLILKALSQGRCHGYGIARWIEQGTDNVVRVEEGSLYPALYRMEKKGWIEAQWDISELKRRAKFYSLTPMGRRQLVADTKRWAAFSAAVSKVLRPA